MQCGNYFNLILQIRLFYLQIQALNVPQFYLCYGEFGITQLLWLAGPFLTCIMYFSFLFNFMRCPVRTNMFICKTAIYEHCQGILFIFVSYFSRA